MHPKEMAPYVRSVWKEFDKGRIETAFSSITRLYEALGMGEKALYNSNLIICALWTAEGGKSSTGRVNDKGKPISPQFYITAKNVLKDLTKNNGLGVCPIYPIVIWKANENNEKGIMVGLVEDHMSQFSHIPEKERAEFANFCAEKLFSAAIHYELEEFHAMDRTLERYLEVLLKASHPKQ